MNSTHPCGTAHEPGSASYLVDWRASLRQAERACCCPAKPAVVVIVPSGPARPAPSELLLCRHHYVASERVLVAGGAAVFDAEGEPLTAHTWGLLQSGATMPAVAAAPAADDGG